MSNDRKNQNQINEVISKLPSEYISDLAQLAYGVADATSRRRIKYWRTGGLKDPIESKRLLNKAKELRKLLEREAGIAR
jgi:hypothetical protein